ncbi:MAG: thermonuclease family protein [Bauldia sp.]|nr:thermonuclease family protein [Bauldia sp.]
MDRKDHLGEPVSGRRRRARSLVPAAAAVLSVLALTPLAAAPAEEPAAEIVPRATRNVTPPGVTPGPTVDGPLVREPLPPPPPEPAKWRRFFLPVTTDAGTFRAGALTIRVSGVDPVKVDQTCKRTSGEEWPCGKTGLHALRMFLRGRAIECYFPPPGAAEQVIAPCRVGQTDLGIWLLAQGWATPNDFATDDYRAAAITGRCERHGMWQGSASDGTCPATAN